MVIINSQSSQLCNRLFGFSSFIANSLTYKYKLVNIGFYKYKSYFEATDHNYFDGYPITIKRSFSYKLDHLYSNVFKNWFTFTHRRFGKTPTLKKFYHTNFSNDITQKIFDLNDSNFVADAQNKVILAQGWMFRDLQNLRKHRETICKFFTPVKPYQTEINRIANEVKIKADVVIGVHIRRGDYKEFANGKWFFTDENYASWMHALKSEYSAIGKTCVFLITSNDMVEIDKFAGLDVIVEPRHFIIDLYLLAKCDAIIGPPSTFSQWAAFYGNKPLTMLLNVNQKIGIAKQNPNLLPEENFSEKELYKFVI
ncbi:hypothetical protein EZJ43_10625 [Pedobacter changchengzhani]|uniref:Glycosyl transferase family 11 n=1 Tax=Pedobacter changchengzhani TaxID=2529274 RepID=A0A4R5MLK9_9SPHI|nr:alpha-1,2-fucosyltransferase [Pedobacter changchengzhani]TDG36125.1 hypothetical protein EZJ43_10625 [Pedobacter changchengzhani]